MKNIAFLTLLSISTSIISAYGQYNLSNNPDSVTFHTADITNFWKVFDKTEPEFDPDLFQKEYIAIGSKGLQGFIPNRIESGENISKAIKNNLNYYNQLGKVLS